MRQRSLSTALTPRSDAAAGAVRLCYELRELDRTDRVVVVALLRNLLDDVDATA